MARPDLVPTMADTLDVVARAHSRGAGEGAGSGWRLRGTWSGPRLPGRANFQYCFSASDSHNRANIGRDHGRQPRRAAGGGIAAAAASTGSAAVHRHLFHLPVRRRRPGGAGASIANDPRADGADDIVVCDTLGQAIPAQVERRVAARCPKRPGHGASSTTATTPGGWASRTPLPPCRAEPTIVDGALGGLGGCPSPPARQGTPRPRTSCSPSARLAEPWTVRRARPPRRRDHRSTLDEPNRSRSRAGARSKAEAFEWVIR